MRIALTIAGSDSGGGAGIQADLKTFHQFGVFGTSVVVALTAQNTLGVSAVQEASVELVDAQCAALAEDLPADAVKTGMLASAALAHRVAVAIQRYDWGPYVLDPVMVASSGDRLLTHDAEAVVQRELLPLATLVTPNLYEAALLTGLKVEDKAGMRRAAEALLALGADAALVKGGHLPGNDLVDVLIGPDGIRRFAHRRIRTTSTHGTGCTLSAGITAALALGMPLEQAVETALDYVLRAMAAAPGLGRGHGPVNHAVAAITPSISRATRSPT